MEKITLTVTQSALAIIANALQQRPYIEAAALLAELDKQIQAQRDIGAAD